jgi:hypothetical protein
MWLMACLAGQVTDVWRNIEARSCNHFCSGKKNYIFWVCVCSLKYPACNAHVPCHLCPVRLCIIFPHYLMDGTTVDKRLLNTQCRFWFSIQRLSESLLILRKTERDTIKNVHWSACTVPVILVRFWGNLNFLDIFSKNTQISNFIKILPDGVEFFHADGRTDRRTDVMKLMVAFRNFANVSQKQ